MTLFFAGVLVGLAAGLWANRRAVTRRSEVISWMGEDIDRLHDKVNEVEATDRKRERWRDLALAALDRHTNGTRVP